MTRRSLVPILIYMLSSRWASASYGASSSCRHSVLHLWWVYYRFWLVACSLNPMISTMKSSLWSAEFRTYHRASATIFRICEFIKCWLGTGDLYIMIDLSVFPFGFLSFLCYNTPLISPSCSRTPVVAFLVADLWCDFQIMCSSSISFV